MYSIKFYCPHLQINLFLSLAILLSIPHNTSLIMGDRHKNFEYLMLLSGDIIKATFKKEYILCVILLYKFPDAANFNKNNLRN